MKPLIFSLALSFPALCQAADTAMYWNASGTGNSPAGGSGTWDTTSLRWMLGLSVSPYYGSSARWIQKSVVLFPNSPGNVTLASPVSVRALAFLAGGYTLSATGSNSITLVDDGSTSRIEASAGTTTISAPLVGTGTTLFDGNSGTPPVIILLGDNTWSGGTIINPDISLQIGNNSTTGTIPDGSIRLNGGLVLFRSDAVTYPNRISGNGKLIKKGGNVAVFTGEVEQLGGIEIQQGNIQIGNGSASGDLNTKVSGSGQLIFNHSNSIQLDSLYSAITGSVSLVKRGTGVLQITGVMTNTGGTTIEAGTLRIGSGGSTQGVLTGSVAIQAGSTFETQVGGDRTISNNLTGAGQLVVTGGQILTYTGISSHTGGTTIASGSTLVVGNGGGSGWMGGAFVTNGTLKFNIPGSKTWSGPVSGTGGLEHLGTGTSILTGTNTYTGTTTAYSGKLTVNGSLAGGGSTLIGPNASLGGSGSIQGPVTINGTHEPGDGTGKQQFASTLGYGPASRIRWELAGNSDTEGGNSFDRIQAAAVSVASGAAVDFILNATGSSVSMTDAFWSQPRSWRLVQSQTRSGTFTLGMVGKDSGGRSASSYGLFSIKHESDGATLVWQPSTPLLNWRLTTFGNRWNEPGFGNPLDDPDKDGVPNLLEYVFASSPTTSSPVGPSPLPFGNDGEFRARYVRNKAAAAGLQVIAEYAISPSGPWDSTGVIQEVIHDDGTMETVLIRKAVGSAPTGVLRVRVTTP